MPGHQAGKVARGRGVGGPREPHVVPGAEPADKTLRACLEKPADDFCLSLIEGVAEVRVEFRLGDQKLDLAYAPGLGLQNCTPLAATGAGRTCAPLAVSARVQLARPAETPTMSSQPQRSSVKWLT